MVHWQQEGHIGNKNGTLATRRAYWQQKWYAGNKERILATKMLC